MQDPIRCQLVLPSKNCVKRHYRNDVDPEPTLQVVLNDGRVVQHGLATVHVASEEIQKDVRTEETDCSPIQNLYLRGDRQGNIPE